MNEQMLKHNKITKNEPSEYTGFTRRRDKSKMNHSFTHQNDKGNGSSPDKSPSQERIGFNPLNRKSVSFIEDIPNVKPDVVLQN